MPSPAAETEIDRGPVVDDVPPERTIELRKLPQAERLAFVVEMMRDLSRQNDPQKMVIEYGKWMRQVIPSDAFLSLSRRGLRKPEVRITRSSRFTHQPNPWKQADLLPVVEGGLLADLIYGNEPVVIDDLTIPHDDPAADYLVGYRSLVAIPLFDGGEAINMVLVLRKRPGAFIQDDLPEHVWLSNLFGRATSNLVLSEKVQEAYDAVDRELKAVGEIQRSLLPTSIPHMRGLDVAAYYQTSKRAGGDYYDFFPLPDDRWGLLVADVSGHGTPAAVLMAITHSLAHSCGEPHQPPAHLLNFVNNRLAHAYTSGTGNFVTAFYGVWDPETRVLTYATAGHPAPRLRRPDGTIETLDGEYGLPLGILHGEVYVNNTRQLAPGDALVLYTDGITEARDPCGEMFENDRLDAAIRSSDRAATDVMDAILLSLDTFADGRPANDDRTVLVAKVRE